MLPESSSWKAFLNPAVFTRLRAQRERWEDVAL